MTAETDHEQHMASKDYSILRPQWAYRVDREVDDPNRISMLSWGARDRDPADTRDSIAKHVAGVHRRMFPTYDGPLHVWVWWARADEHYSYPVPDDALEFVYAPGTPDIPPPEPCDHGKLPGDCPTCDDPL